MKKVLNPCLGPLSVGAMTIAAAFSVGAQELDAERLEAIAEMTTPRSEVNLGIGYLSEDSRRLGQYSGMRDLGFYGLMDFNMVSLDKSSGTWTRLYGRNLGLENREAAFEQNRQGQWRYFIGFNQTPRYEPYVVNTAVSGIGSEIVTVPATSTAGAPVDLSLKRELVSAGFDASIDKRNMLRVKFTHETKEGSRLYGRGTSGAIEFLPEPDDRTTETLEAYLSHTGKDFQLSGGYYGTLFVNHAEGLYVSGGNAALASPASSLANPNSPFTPMSQPLSNDSHQLFLTGGYNFTPLTRTSFKFSETMARQNETFIPTGSAPLLAGAPTSMDGRVDTTLAYLDLTSVEFDRIDLQANIRYEDRDDRTPEVQYMSGYQDGVTASVPNAFYSGSTGYNKPRSWASLKTKLEAGYLLPENFKLMGGWELDQQKRESPELFRKVNFREETDENTFRLELKRSLFDSLNASISVSQARRTGSDYLQNTYVNVNNALPGSPTSDLVNPLLWADRDRKAWKATAQWAPIERLSIHLVVEEANDHYEGKQMGPREGGRKFASIDASYSISERWLTHFWWSSDTTRAEQTTRTNPASALSQDWQANLVQASEGLGAGVQGRMRNGIEMGADAAYSKQTAEQRMGAVTGAAITSLPDYYYRLTEIKLYGSMPVDKASGVRMDYAFYDWKTDDWTWANWQYRDGTTLTQDSSQQTHFIGASYYYRWQ